MTVFFRYLRRAVLVLTAAAVSAFALALLYHSFAPPVSTLMLARLATGESYQRNHVLLRDIAPVLVASVIASEDAGFCRNRGVEWTPLRQAIDDTLEGEASRGASTITMQTAKNLFLWPSRSVVRKAMEIPIALFLGLVWSKAHTMEVYLNIAEWGEGLFGVEAAAQRYFRKRARDLNAREAALLATALPSPLRRNAGRPQTIHSRLAARIVTRARSADVACLR